MKKHHVYFGKKFFERDDGYLRSTTSREALYAHRWVWMLMYGEIPKGMVIHHLDGNRANNEITNLQMLDRSTHTKHHWRKRKHNPNQLWLGI
jgi:HNH endonuclease